MKKREISNENKERKKAKKNNKKNHLFLYVHDDDGSPSLDVGG
jgi:hypothetical protein